MECADLSRGRLKDLEQDRSERTSALRTLLRRLAEQIIEHSKNRTEEIDELLFLLEQTVAAQRVYDSSARLKVNLSKLPHDSDNDQPRRKVAFPDMTTRRRVGFAAEDNKEYDPPTCGDDDSTHTKAGDQTTCYTPFTPAPLCMQHIDDGCTALLRSPDKCSDRTTVAPQAQTTKEVTQKTKEVAQTREYSLADFLTVKPCGSLAESHGPALHAALESVLLLQKQLSHSVGNLEREVVPDLRSVRILFFRAAQKAEAALQKFTEELDDLQAECDKLYRELTASMQLKPVTTKGDEPFFFKVRDFQNVLTAFLAAVLEPLGDLNNAEVKCGRLFCQIGYSWQDTFSRSMLETTKRLARIRPAFFQNDGTLGVPMMGGSPLAGFPQKENGMEDVYQNGHQMEGKQERDDLSPRWSNIPVNLHHHGTSGEVVASMTPMTPMTSITPVTPMTPAMTPGMYNLTSPVTPQETTPQQTTPQQTTPQQTTPQQTTPQQTTPQQTTPQQTTPQQTTPQQTTPRGMTPQETTPQGMTPQGMTPQGMTPPLTPRSDDNTPRGIDLSEELLKAPLCGRSVRSLHSTFKMDQIPFGDLSSNDENERTEQVATAKFIMSKGEDYCLRAEDWAAITQWARLKEGRPSVRAAAFVNLATLCCGQ